MKKIVLVLAAILLEMGFLHSQLNITIQAPNANSNTQLRMPNGTSSQGGLKGVYLIRQSELSALTGSIVNSIGFSLLNGVSGVPVSGSFTVYLQNTTDVTYTKGTSFSSAITGMAIHTTTTMVIPMTNSSATITLPFSPTFTYTGGGIYVGVEWSSAGPFSTQAATWDANYIVGSGLGATSFQSTPPASNVMTITDFRPAFLLEAVNTASNEIGITRTDAPGKTPLIYGAQVITSDIKNSSTITQNNIPVTLNITGSNSFVDTQTITSLAPGSVTTVSFAPFTPAATGINNISVSVPADQNLNNNLTAWTQSATCTNVSLLPVLPAGTFSSTGYGAGANTSGLIYAFRHVPAVNTTITAVRTLVPGFSNAANLGKQIRSVLLDGAGNILALGNNTTITAGMLDVFTAYSFPGPMPALTAGTTYYIGMAIPANGYYPIGAAVNAVANWPIVGFSSFPITGGAGTPLSGINLSLEGVLTSGNLSVTGGTTICSGSSATLTAGGSPTYTWSTSSNSSSIVVSPAVSTTYTVSAGSAGCVQNSIVQVAVASVPMLAVSGATGACIGAPAFILTASGASTYMWNTGSTSSSIYASTGTAGVFSYTVTGTNAPCVPVTAVKSITISALPVVNLVIASSTVCTMATGGNTLQLFGSPAGGVYSGSGVSGGIFIPNTVGTPVLNYAYTDPQSGCSNSSTTSIQVIACEVTNTTSVGSVLMSNANVVLYPNPSSQGIAKLKNLEGTNLVTIYNMIGTVIESHPSNSTELLIDLSKYAQGNYFIKVTDSVGHSRVLRMVYQD